ncbi:dihydrofolate reductase-like domain-containing protein [Mycena maculata]|uniref:2,5-diamino-6-ribosylamino-4(3H)-pyrimidinone 5'-phosphate reductase n=1 Tax=Mycena maculata TaxID=230809 RepID=A0AAD7IV85_9AGAR|nr:dihydrofolate reductase-like domain-containing protein [Mycena maculata]
MPPPPFLTALLEPYAAPPPPTRPHVTLTFAQSLDGKIGGLHSTPLPLSGAESMQMTHWLRTLHEGILVGGATARGDDPQLNTRHLPPPARDAPPHPAPRPIVLDSTLLLSPSCKLLRNFNAGTGRRPWIVGVGPPQCDAEWEKRRTALEGAGARVLLLDLSDTEREATRTPALLALLRAQGVRTLMVEGGARVIRSFLSAPCNVDTILITTAPVLVGPGVDWADGVGKLDAWRVVETRLVGRDSVVALVARPEEEDAT